MSLRGIVCSYYDAYFAICSPNVKNGWPNRGPATGEMQSAGGPQKKPIYIPQLIDIYREGPVFLKTTPITRPGNLSVSGDFSGDDPDNYPVSY